MAEPAPAHESGEERPARAAENPAELCPTCSAQLEARQCKLVCRSCGYYMSCSDYI